MCYDTGTLDLTCSMAKYISRTALLWSVLCCGVLASVGLPGGNTPRGSQRIQAPVQGQKQPQWDVTGSARQFSEPKLVTKREAVTTNCSEVESPAEPGLHKIKEIHQLEYTFYIKPEPEFRALVFHMKINNLWNTKDPYTTNEKIVFSGSEMGGEDNSWREVRVKYYRHEVRLGRDRHGLNVSVGELSQSIKSSRWWRTHSFEGFVLLVGGPAKLRFDCLPRNPGQPMPVQLMREPVVLGCVLGGVTVLVVAVWVALAVIRPAPPSDNPPPVPPLPKSLLLKRGHKDDPEATYEEFNEATLLLLRQMLDPDTFASCSSVSSGDTPTGRHEAAGDDGTKTSRPICGEGIGKFSLLEEKQKAWLENPSGGPAPESHYVEMHGIINGNSDFAQ